MKYKTIKEGNLFRLVALKDFADVNVGDIGGLIESERNLDQHGTCWVYKNAKVTGDAHIYENASISGHCKISGHPLIGGNAIIDEWATVCDGAHIQGYAVICGNAQIYGYPYINGNAHIYGNAKVHGDAHIYGRSQVYEDANIYSSARLHKSAIAKGHSEITTELTGPAIVIEGLGPIITITDRHIQIRDQVVEFTDRSFLETKLLELFNTL